MIVTNSEPSLTQLALTQAARPTPMAASSPPVVNQAGAPASATPPAADLLVILQQPNDPPDVPLPASDLARRYAESGTLTAREQVAAPTSSGLAAADDRLLSDLSQAYRAPASSDLRATGLPVPGAQSAAATVIIDGRAVVLSPAQAAAVRAALGPSLRRLGPGAGTSDNEDPTTVLAQASGESKPARIVALTPAAAMLDGDPQHHAAGQDRDRFDRHGLDDAVRPTAPTAARPSHNHPVPYEPAVIVLPPQDPVVLAPGPHTQPFVAATPAAVSGVAIAFGAGVAPQDVVARWASGQVTISAGGSDVIAIAVTEPVAARLVFADGTTSVLHLSG